MREKWPKKEELDKVLKKLEKVEGTAGLPENPTVLQKFRWQICQEFIRYVRYHNLKNRELAEELRIDEGDASKILHHQIEKFSTDRLLSLLQKIMPDYSLQLKGKMKYTG